jgi:excisionase family DNA binding protein
MRQSSITSVFPDGAFRSEGNCPAFGQPHYTVDQVAEMWSISRDTIRRLFAAEPGVLKIVRPGNRYKRTYSTLRIPESVLNRVYRRIGVRQ